MKQNKNKLSITDKIYLGMLCETLPSWVALKNKYSPNTDLATFLTSIQFDESVPKKDKFKLKWVKKHATNLVNYFNSLGKSISFEQWLFQAREINYYAKKKN